MKRIKKIIESIRGIFTKGKKLKPKSFPDDIVYGEGFTPSPDYFNRNKIKKDI